MSKPTLGMLATSVKRELAAVEGGEQPTDVDATGLHHLAHVGGGSQLAARIDDDLDVAVGGRADLIRPLLPEHGVVGRGRIVHRERELEVAQIGTPRGGRGGGRRGGAAVVVVSAGAAVVSVGAAVVSLVSVSGDPQAASASTKARHADRRTRKRNLCLTAFPSWSIISAALPPVERAGSNCPF